MRNRFIQALLTLVLTTSVTAINAQVTNEDLATAADDNSQWLTYGRDQGETRFSPLEQINDSNVSQLGVAWTFDTGSFRGLEATPLVANGIMYATRPWSSVFAVNARTGALVWDYDPQVDRAVHFYRRKNPGRWPGCSGIDQCGNRRC